MTFLEVRLLRMAKKKERLCFYQSVIKENDLVFDVGANRGNRSSTFLDLKAQVISIEPNPRLVKKLLNKFGKKLKVVQKAVGGSAGLVELYVNEADVLSTTSKEWMEETKKSNRFGDLGNKFSEVLEVEKVTLDDLVREYGVPEFVKIDVEGLELEIIQSISNAKINSLSFEFAIPESLKDTLDAIDHLDGVGYKYFNLSIGESMEFITIKHFSTDEMKRLLDALPAMSWGDIYAFSGDDR